MHYTQRLIEQLHCLYIFAVLKLDLSYGVVAHCQNIINDHLRSLAIVFRANYNVIYPIFIQIFSLIFDEEGFCLNFTIWRCFRERHNLLAVLALLHLTQ